MKKILAAAAVFVLLVLAGFLIPIGSYTTTKGCLSDKTPTKRLNLILGDSLDEVKKRDVEPPPNAGCSLHARYVLYVL